MKSRASDDLLATIEAVHAAALDAARWPQALAAVARVVGGTAATLEVVEKPSLRHREFQSFGAPPAQELAYLDHYAALSPRLPFVSQRKSGELGWDYQILDDKAMDRSPFYAEFLARMDMRYFVFGILAANEREFSGVTVNRPAKQGHIDRAGIAVMARLVPHMRQALDVAARLKGAGEERHSLERTLDWLADGVMLIGADGTVIYANEAFHAIARRDDGIRFRRGAIDFNAADAGARLDAAIGTVGRLRSGDARVPGIVDFPVARPSGAPPYLVSVRPIVPAGREGKTGGDAAAIIFIRDPVGRSAAPAALLREVFGFTDAEANLAQALQGGVSLGDYARARMVSLNTLYTHLRRIKEKTGCKRMAELIHKLNDLQVPLRLD